MLSFILNNELISTDKPPGYRVLDFIRTDRNLTGTKESCREGDCGACTVLLGERIENKLFYHTTTSCLLLLGEIHGKHVVTIEGLNQKQLNILQQCIVDEHASQCGYCTPGIMSSITGYLLNCEVLTYDDMLLTLDGNICRCTGYNSIKRAVKEVTTFLAEKADLLINSDNRIKTLVEWKILPEYFLNIEKRLNEISPGNNVTEDKTQIVIAGGTDLVVQRDEEVGNYDLVFINKLSKETKIKIEDEYCYISASATVTDIYESKKMLEIIPEIKNKFHLISSTPIRNMATLGGNLVNASPIGDLSVFFLALDSELILSDTINERVLDLKDFFVDYKKLDLRQNELIKWLRFPLLSLNQKVSFEKVSKRERLDIASVNSAVKIQIDNKIIKSITLSAGGIAPIPKYFTSVKKVIGKKLSESTIKEIVNLCYEEIAPISDIRGSKEYKRLLLRQLIYAHFLTLFGDNISPEKLI